MDRSVEKKPNIKRGNPAQILENYTLLLTELIYKFSQTNGTKEWVLKPSPEKQFETLLQLYYHTITPRHPSDTDPRPSILNADGFTNNMRRKGFIV